MLTTILRKVTETFSKIRTIESPLKRCEEPLEQVQLWVTITSSLIFAVANSLLHCFADFGTALASPILIHHQHTNSQVAPERLTAPDRPDAEIRSIC